MLPQVLGFVMQMLLVTLRDPGNGIDAKFFTREVLEGKDKKPGWVQMTMAKFPVVRQLLNLAANVPSSLGTSMHSAKEKIASLMGSPAQFSETFHMQTLVDDDGDVDGGKSPEENVGWSASGTDLAQIIDGMPKCLAAFVELLHNVYGGDYDEEVTALAGLKSVRDALMDDDMLGGVSPTLQCKMREALRLVATEANQFITCEKEQALVTVRSLKRIASNPDDAEVAAALKERTHLWEKAREQRRKFVALSLMKQPTKAKLEAAVARMAPSKLGTTNRLFVWSADLVAESGTKPWQEESSPKSRESDVVLDFMSKVSGLGDFAICFDGRMRKVRTYLEGKMEAGGKSPEEIFMFYANEGESSGGNKIFMGAKMHEVAYVNLPCLRQRMTVIKRTDQFVPKAESTTHCPTFANVPLPSVSALPRISTMEKATVFPASSAGDPLRAACPAKWDFGGVPLFWRESKKTELWEAILTLLNVKSIVDFTPGSGALACAAMSRGLKYTGFVEDAKHLAWLQNIMDTASLRFIAKKGEALYMEDLAELITQHYQDLLEEEDERPDVEGLFDDDNDE